MRTSRAVRIVVCASAFASVTLCYAVLAQQAQVQGNASPPTSLTTQERMYVSAFWPTRGDAAAAEYAGEAACEKCHANIASRQHQTPMYHAATRGSQLTIPGPLKFQEGTLSYSVTQASAGAIYAVNSESRPVAWAVGNAETGQTYLLKQGDSYIESRLSYYTALKALDITVGHSEQLPSSLRNALGHELTFDTVQRCFACHTTASTLSDVFVPENAVPGVTCEACHGPGAAHVAAARQHGPAVPLADPASMSPSDSVDFCGSCHRTFSDVTVFMPANLGAVSVRFQPYRLEKSRCWGKTGDARITCVACHDPHEPLVRDDAAYDQNCLACHNSQTPQPDRRTASSPLTPSAPACKVAASHCVSCHMPKVEVRQAHATFTDHQIRIVRASIPHAP